MLDISTLSQALQIANNNSSPSDNSDIIEKIIHAETAHVIACINTILQNHQMHSNDQTLFNDLKTYLSNRWDDIAGFYPAYTTCPASKSTQLCLKVAQWLHQQDNSKSIYQYLMPTLTHIHDSLFGFYVDNIDEFKLSQCILSEDKKSLIPTRLIENLSPTRNVNLDNLVKPYVENEKNAPLKLTAKERIALIKHSTTSKAFYTHYEDILSCQANSISLGGEIYRLIKGLRLGGKNGPYGGNDEMAAAVAYEAINHFMIYWNLLDADLKNRVKLLRANAESQSLQQIIDILIKVDNDSLDCVEVNSDKLEVLLNTHRELYAEGKNNPIFLNNLIENFEKLKIELEKGVDSQENLPLGVYCFQFLDPTIKTKLEHQDLMSIINENSKNATSIVQMICQVPGLLTKQMLTNADAKQITLFFWATKTNRVDVIESILAINAEVDVINVPNKLGFTPLMMAAMKGYTDAAKLIVESNSDINVLNAQNEFGETPLKLALIGGHTDIAELILKKNLDPALVKTQDNYGCTPLYLAALWGNTAIAKLILQRSPELSVLNARTHKKGETPLTIAASKGYLDIVQLILEENSSSDVLKLKNNAGKTALMLALENGHKEIAQLLVEKDKIFKQLNNQIAQLEGIDETHDHLRAALINLRHECAAQLVDCLSGSQPEIETAFAQSSSKTIIDETCLFLNNFLWPSNNRAQKIHYINQYENKMYPFKDLKFLGKCLGVIVVAALCAATGAAIGIGAGLLAGAWSGPGAIVSAFTGMLMGGFTAWNIGVTAGATLVGVAGAAVATYGFFKPSPKPPVHQAIDNVIDKSLRCALATDKVIDPFNLNRLPMLAVN